MTTLKKEDKAQIIEARLRAVEVKKYSLEVDLMVENNKNEPAEEAIANLNSAIQECNNQMSVLNQELTTVNQLEEQVIMPNLELVVAALQERIGQLVANYETQVALLRAELTELSQKEKAKEDYSKSLDEKLGE